MVLTTSQDMRFKLKGCFQMPLRHFPTFTCFRRELTPGGAWCYLSMTAMAAGPPAPRSQPPLTVFIQHRALSHHLFLERQQRASSQESYRKLQCLGTDPLLRSRRLERAACVESIFNFISREKVTSLQGNESDDSCGTALAGHLERARRGRLSQLGCDQSIISYLTPQRLLAADTSHLPLHLALVRYIAGRIPEARGHKDSCVTVF